LVFAVVGLGLGLVVIVGGYLALGRSFGHAKNPGRGVFLELTWPGDLPPKEAARLLEHEGLVSAAPLPARPLPATTRRGLRPGPHFLRDALSPRELVRSLQRSQARPSTRLTFPEGSHRFAMAQRLE